VAPPRQRPGGRRLLAVVLAFVLAAACAEPAPSIPPGPPAPEPSPAMEPPFAAWREAEFGVPVGDARIEHVAAVPGGYLAAGFDLRVHPGATHEAPHLRLWRTSDGRRWEPVMDHPEFAGFEPAGITVSGGRATVWGELDTNRAVLQSPDLGSWTLVDLSTASNPGRMVGIAEVGDRPIVLYHNGWTAVPGATGRWGSRELPDDLRGLNGVEPMLDGLIAGGPGLIAFGAREALTPSGRTIVPAIWTSSDGLTWTPAELGVRSRGGGIEAVAAGPNGFVAVGRLNANPAYAASWISHDGMSWRRVELGGGGLPAAWTAVVAGGSHASGFVASATDDPLLGGLWWSGDGLAWCRTDPLPARSMAVTPAGLLATAWVRGRATLLTRAWPSDCMPGAAPEPGTAAWTSASSLPGFRVWDVA
jgi:hypothetical protein